MVHLVRSAVGPVPKPARRAPGSVALAAAGTVVLGCCLAPMGRDVRLSAALALEGLLGWYQAADPHLQPPQQAIAYALRHAGARLEEEGRPRPAALSAAIEEHRKIAPMAGGGSGRSTPSMVESTPCFRGSSSVRHTLVLPIDPRIRRGEM